MANLCIKDLPGPVNAAKADWLIATDWIGFTPGSDEPHSASQCQATINRQMGDGYVVEYITKSIEKPNAGFENDPGYLEDVKAHAEVAGCLVAVHRLRPSMLPLRTIMGDEGYDRLQDMWAEGGRRRRWSVAFPIIESFDIVGKPDAKLVLTKAAYDRLFMHSSATLRPIDDDERAMLADLPLVRRPALNAWIAIEDEIKSAERSTLPPTLIKNINSDLALSAMEGMTEERKAKIRRRAAWVANRFVQERQKAGTLFCDHCAFDPSERVAGSPVKARSLLDVHHLHPLDEGQRRTWLTDFGLLCPICHRMEHELIKHGLSVAVASIPRPTSPPRSAVRATRPGRQ